MASISEKQVNAATPKYQSLAQQLRQRILSRELYPGDRLPTFAEMRSEYNVTSSTVERMYGVLEQEGLIERQPRRGLFVAEQKRVLTGNVGFIRSFGFQSMRDPFAAHLNMGIQQAATQHQQRLMSMETAPGWDATDLIKNVDGLLLSGHPAAANKEIMRLKPAKMPCISLLVVADGMTNVIVDDYGAAKIAMEHLLENGHRRIACLMEETRSISHILRDRVAGYEDAMEKAGIEIKPGWERLANAEEVVEARQTHLQWGREQMREWLKSGWHKLKCTAILAQNDHVAIGAMQVLQEAGIDVPDEVSVMGFDGTELCDYVTPRLSSVQLPLEQMGVKAMKLLMAQIENGYTEEQVIMLPTKLRAGDSVARV
jgi:DNA-binding LacI/PurR family transcriptional regulator